MLWKDVSKEEKRACREWAMAQTGILRAYKKGELNGLQYRSYKKKLEDLLGRIEEHYGRVYQDTD
ncbi:MAG: hypothetical protein IJF87_08585 [Erysipelotrichaceae bacterium]|nr:hypothetical protein [Erysipelotrichaceae bacterium]